MRSLLNSELIETDYTEYITSFTRSLLNAEILESRTSDLGAYPQAECPSEGLSCWRMDD
jgi:hypothetical protein